MITATAWAALTAVCERAYPREACGWLTGAQEVANHLHDANYLSRAVLLSDGLANVGITEPDDALPVQTVVGEELAIAGRKAGRNAVLEWLHEHDHGRAEFRKGQLVIIDEATLAGTLTLDRITGIASSAVPEAPRAESSSTSGPSVFCPL